MNSTAIDRRSLLLGTLAAVKVAAFGGAAMAAEGGDAAAYVSAAKLGDGSFAIVLLAADGRLLRQIPLSDRGHDIALDLRRGCAVAFARRPGTFAVAFDTSRAAAPQIFVTPPGRHFFGHGAFSVDGRLLYASENDNATGQGVIGIYDAGKEYTRVGEMPSHGIGPHEIILMPDGVTLAVANGGIDTTPEAGRENLNIETMQASLAFVDVRTGNLIAKHDLPEGVQRLSIRHLAADSSSTVWFGGQWQGETADAPELIGRAKCDAPLRLITPDKPLGSTLKGYIGSMAASADGRIIAASAPKAGQAVYIDAATGRVAGHTVIKDVCGIAGLSEHSFALTSGLGAFRVETDSAQVMSAHALSDIAFDNHLRRLT